MRHLSIVVLVASLSVVGCSSNGLIGGEGTVASPYVAYTRETQPPSQPTVLRVYQQDSNLQQGRRQIVKVDGKTLPSRVYVIELTPGEHEIVARETFDNQGISGSSRDVDASVNSQFEAGKMYHLYAIYEYPDNSIIPSPPRITFYVYEQGHRDPIGRIDP